MKLKNRKIYITWIICHITIIIISIIFNGFIGYNINRLIMNEVNQNTNLILKQFRQTVDDEYNQIKKSMLKAAINPNLTKIINYKEPLSGEQMLNISELINDIQNNKYDDIYIYLNSIDYIIKKDISMKSQEYFKYYGDEYLDYNSWISFIKGNSNYIINKNNTVLFIEPLTLFNNKIYGKICFRLNISPILKSVHEYIGKKNNTLIIIDNNNEVVAASKELDIEDTIFTKLNKESDIFIKNNKIISYIVSDNKQWKYVYIIENNIYKQKRDTIIKIILIFIGVYILISSVLVLIITKINYKPIKQIVNTIDRKKDINNNWNELHIIKQYLDLMNEENKKMDSFISKQRDFLKDEYIKKLLLGEYVNYEDKILQQIGLDLQGELFAVALIYIDCIDDQHLLENDNKFEFVRFIISNVFEEIISKEGKGNIIYIDGFLVCLINTGNKSKNEITNCINQGINFLDNQFDIEITVALSNIHKTVSNIMVAYDEVLKAIEYKFIMNNGKIIDFNDIASVNHNEKYYYPIDIARQLTNSMKSGNYEQAKKVLNNIFEVNFMINTLSPKMAKSLLLELSSTIIKVYKDSEIISEEELINVVVSFEQLLSYDNIADMKDGIIKMIKTYSRRTNTFNENAENYIKYNVQNYISNQIENPDLNITTIAEHFSLHPFYLSKIYREKNNESILDTITRIRIEKAKELLKEFTVKEVAIKVGYTNTRTFTRGFKKLEGTTPGIYKKQI